MKNEPIPAQGPVDITVRPLVERLRQVRHATHWTRGIDVDYPVAWEPESLCQEAAAEIERLIAALNVSKLQVEIAKMPEATKYLKMREWSMGNGQCPDCYGVPENWYGHPLHMKTDSIGHEAVCTLAVALRELGEKPLMKGEFKAQERAKNAAFRGRASATCEGPVE